MADYSKWSEKELRRVLLRSIKRDVGIPGNGMSDYKTLLDRIRTAMRNKSKVNPFEHHSLNQLRAVVTEKGYNFHVAVKSTDYFPTLEVGRGKSNNTSEEEGGWSDPNTTNSRIRRWIKKNKISLYGKYSHFPDGKEKSEEQKRRSLAYIIGRQIHQQGTARHKKHKDVYTSVIDRWERFETEKMYDMLEEYGFSMIYTIVPKKK